MACGCKKNQANQAPKNESVKRSNPTVNGVRGLRTEKRIIR